jgi:hypothetical protein
MPFLTNLFGKAAPILERFAGRTMSAGTAKLVGTAIGATTGGMIGAASAQPGDKKKGFITGALAGGGAGYFGGKTLQSFTKGGVGESYLKGLSSEMGRLSTSTSNSEAMQGINKYLAKNWSSPGHLEPIPTGNIAGKTTRPMLGFKQQSPIATAPDSKGLGAVHAVGNLSKNIDAIMNGGYGLTGKNMATRGAQVLGRDINESRYFTKDNLKYKRSALGQALGVTMMSGAGIGAMEGASATNKDGTPASLPKRVFKGTTTALGWGLAAPIMGAKALAYDIPKSIINPES